MYLQNKFQLFMFLMNLNIKMIAFEDTLRKNIEGRSTFDTEQKVAGNVYSSNKYLLFI